MLTPDSPSAAWHSMIRTWDKIDAVLSGTEAIRLKGETYLPRYESEKETNYRNRLIRAVLTNVSSQTLESWVGRPFSDPIVMTDIPEVLSGVLEDVDLQGNAVGVFARKWFREGLGKALAHVLVDFPAISIEGERQRTLADDLREGRRPFWSFIKPENLIFAASIVRNGKEILTHVRIREGESARDEWGEKYLRRVRTFDHDPDTGITEFSVYEPGEKQEEWRRIVGPSRIDLDRIPLVTFYADRVGLMTGKPPIEDLVDLNVSHWQHSSDQDNILIVARFPLLCASGVSQEQVDHVVLSPRKILSTPTEGGRWYFTEHSGAAIAAGREHIRDLEERMSHYGAEFLRRRPGTETATARALDSAEATSPLQDAAVRFNDVLAQALWLTARWMGIEEPGKIEITTDMGPETTQASDLQTLTTARQMREISRETYLEELKRRGLLADDFDPEEDRAKVEAEMMTGRAETMIDGQAEV